jgi:hypothetical protein
VYDSRGRRIAYNDDSLGGSDSHAQIRVKAGRTYFVEAAGYRDSQGNYSLNITPTGSARHRRAQNRAAATPSVIRSRSTEPAIASQSTNLDGSNSQLSFPPAQPISIADSVAAIFADGDRSDARRDHAAAADAIDRLFGEGLTAWLLD